MRELGFWQELNVGLSHEFLFALLVIRLASHYNSLLSASIIMQLLTLSSGALLLGAVAAALYDQSELNHTCALSEQSNRQ